MSHAEAALIGIVAVAEIELSHAVLVHRCHGAFGIVSCPDMRRPVDLQLLSGKKVAARQAKPLAGR